MYPVGAGGQGYSPAAIAGGIIVKAERTLVSKIIPKNNENSFFCVNN